MFSVNLSSPPEPPVEIALISTVSIFIFRYSTGLSPAFRTTRTASFKCFPAQHANANLGVALSTHFEKLRSCTLALPAPAPPPECAEPALLIPHDQERTSISFLCLES